MKPSVGMFYRYKGQIGKYKKITELDRYPSFTNNYLRESEIILLNNAKFSYNIIDILEVGDYVNASKVIDISIIGKDKEKWVWVEQTEDTNNKYGDDYVGYNNEQIKSIVTHEQMEQMAYVIEKGDDN